MKHGEFTIGLEFRTDSGRWRCTDVGTRVIVAISLEPHEIAHLESGPNSERGRTERREISDDPSLLSGPPYAVVEHVFDEDSLPGCSCP